jgi:hypothetical protein
MVSFQTISCYFPRGDFKAIRFNTKIVESWIGSMVRGVTEEIADWESMFLKNSRRMA